MSAPSGEELAGQVAVVTAAGRGIGRSSAIALAAAGAAVHVSDVDAIVAEDTAAAIREQGGRAWSHHCDVADEKSVNAMVHTVLGVSGRVDVLVSNAGIFPRVPLRETTTELFDRIMAVNFRGGFLLAMAVLPEMEKVGGGSMVFLSSGAGTLAAIEQPLARSLPVYGASKAALDRWALGVAPELADVGIAVNVLYPGAVVRTRGTQGLSLSAEEMDAGIEPDEVAPAVVHLATQRPGSDGMVGKLVKAVDYGETWG